MTTEQAMMSFEEANPHIPFFAPSADGYAAKRETRGIAGQELKPLGIATPQNAEQVSESVRWAIASGVDVTVRSGGNDFFGRNAADGALIIDMRDIKSISIAEDKSTATIGGGIISEDLIRKLDDEGLIAPFGNVWAIGYVGWATLGGYGPLANQLGMGFEGIVGARIVNSKGDVVDATDDALEGIRGMGGNLGIITSLTIKVYPARKLLSGAIILEPSLDNVKAVLAAEDQLGIPKGVTLQHFLLKDNGPVLIVLFTYSGTGEEGQGYFDALVAAFPSAMMKMVEQQTPVQQLERVQIPCLPFGGQRSMHLKRMTPKLLETFMAGFETMPKDANICWSAVVDVDHTTASKNCFGVGRHVLVSMSGMAVDEKMLPAASAWNSALYEKLRASGDDAVLEGSYAALSPPGDRTPEQIFGDKWPRAQELKAKYDPDNVFRYSVPSMHK